MTADQSSGLQERIFRSEIEKARLEEDIKKNGGAIMDGLYHGKRRVRAKYKFYGYNEGWEISSDEKDLICALGMRHISDKINKVDLRKKIGLSVKAEIAPVEITISESGTLAVDRIDDWGDGAKPYIDNTPFFKGIFKSWRFRDIVFLLAFFPMFITGFVSDKITALMNRIVIISVFLASILTSFFVDQIFGLGRDNSEAIFIYMGMFYLFSALLPFFVNGFQKESL